MRRTVVSEALLAAVVLASASSGLAGRAGAARPGARRDPNAPAKPPPAAPKDPKSNLEFWLGRGREARPDQAATRPGVVEPQVPRNPFGRADALPGVVQDSRGRVYPGGLYTTRGKPWMVWVDKDKVWRRIPFVAVLSITAIVVDERMELKWRWKGMGEPERVYTGQSYPARKLKWRFHLIDGSYITGSVNGQPIIVELDGKRAGPFVLHDRQKGPAGQKLKDLAYVKKVIVSRRVMEQVLAERSKGGSGPPEKR